MRQLSPALAQQCAAYEAGENQHPHYAPFHGYGGDPALGTGAFRAETVGTVAAFQVIVEVVDEVGCDLHAAGKQCAQQRRYQVGLAVGKSQCGAYQYRDDCSGQGLGTGGKHPCVE